jgi:hypothetical protein
MQSALLFLNGRSLLDATTISRFVDFLTLLSILIFSKKAWL